MTSAFPSFGLIESISRYILPIYTLCQQRDYKGACDSAVGLKLFDKFPISIFCLPLLLLDKPTTMESYLANSPAAVKEMITFLDDLNEINLEKNFPCVSDLPGHKADGLVQTDEQAPGQDDKKVCGQVRIGPRTNERTSVKTASADLYYWIKQM